MKTKTWESLCIFNVPLSGAEVRFKDSPLVAPNGVEEIIRKNWDSQLKQKQEQLTKIGIKTEIRPYSLDSSEAPLNALYEGSSAKMWPGLVVSLKYIQKTDFGIDLLVGQTCFPFIAGLKDEAVSRLYKEQGISKPRPALGICTYALTQDDQIALTVRGSRTNMYPGRLYGQGGNPLFTNTDIPAHQAGEMKEEILVEDSEYGSFRFGGIIIDLEQLPDKPDLVGWVPIDLESEEIRRRVYSRNLENRPNDSVGVVFAPSSEEGLFDYLVKRTHSIQYCPHAHGGLVLYGHHHFGDEWSNKLLSKLH